VAAQYRRIVDEIAGRITSGQLRPGDRVPSARQITREWGVAIATATKVLSTLTAEGLVQPVVGVGTVVSTVDARPAEVRTPAEVSRERVVRAAIAVADAEGLPAVSMRRLATELGVAAMSLYRYVGNKEELVLLMADAVFSEIDVSTFDGEDWRTRLEAVSRAQWAMSRRHAWLPSVMSLTRPLLAPNGMVLTEWSMRAVHDAGCDLVTALRVSVSLAGFVLGLALSVQLDTEAERETGLTSDEWMQAQDAAFEGIMASGRFPMLAGVGQIPDFDLDLDSLFETGLALMLDGFAALIERGGSAQ
jgi:DNA-binding transcriptional regulator YhcF (GntR family)